MNERFFQGSIAVVGATNNKDKYGFKVFKTLKNRYPEFDIIPVNPNCDSVLGFSCLNSLEEIKDEIDTLVLIVNPEIGLKIVEKAFSKGVKKFWFQPGAESPEIEVFCKEHKCLFSTNLCLL